MSGVSFVAAFEEQNAALRMEMSDLVEKSHDLLLTDVDAAWRRIEAEADRIVQKSSAGLTREQAVSKVLKTKPQLYSDYTSAQDAVRQSLERAEGNAARRSHDQWVRERAVDSVAKADAYGMAEERARELVRDPAIAKAFGGRARQPVEKGSAAWEEIEDRAARLIEKSGEGLSSAQAVERVLQSPEGQRLYSEYMRPVEAGWVADAAALAKADGGVGLNSGEGVSGPSMFGSADGEPLSGRKKQKARQVLLSLAERLEAAQADGEDVEDALRRELSAPVVRQAVVAAVDALEGLEAGERKSRPVAKAARIETTGGEWPETWAGH